MEKSSIKTTLTLTAGLAGAAGIAAIATTPNATHAATETGTVTYKDGATTVWGSPEFDTQSVKRYVVYNQSVNILDQKQVNGATWYKIGANEWIPAMYLKSGDDTQTATKADDQNIDLQLSYTDSAVTVWSDPSFTKPTGDYLTTDDTNITAVSKTTVNGEVWYKLSNGGYVPAQYAGTASEVAAAKAAAAQTSSSTATSQATSAQTTTAASTATSQAQDTTTTTSAAKTDTTATTTKLKVNYADGPVTVWQDTSYSQATGNYLENGSVVSAVASTTVNGEAWYQLSNGGYVPARFVTTNLNTPTTTKKTSQAASTTTTAKSTASAASTTAATKTTTPAVRTTTMKVVYSGGVVTVWNSASTGSGAASYLSNGQKITVSGSKVSGSDGLDYYKLSSGGYVPAKFVTTNLSASVATKQATTTSATTTTTKKATSSYSAPKKTTTTTKTTSSYKAPSYNTSSSSSRSAKVQAVISMARAQIGTPYVWGGKTTSGFDCSGLMYYVFLHAAGKNIGGWTVPQESSGYKVSVSNLQAGDLVFWGSAGSTYHVGLYIGGGQYIHSPQPGQTVTTASISSYFMPSFGVHVNM